jgi:ribonuclease D
MIEYAANDVIYLPQLFYIFCENIPYGKIKNECEKYLEYLNINLNIKNFNKINLETDRVIQGLLK